MYMYPSRSYYSVADYVMSSHARFLGVEELNLGLVLGRNGYEEPTYDKSRHELINWTAMTESYILTYEL
jgi:hypothetical protein